MYRSRQRRGDAAPDPGSARPIGPDLSELTRSVPFAPAEESANSPLAESVSMSIGNPPTYWLILAAVLVAAGVVIALVVDRSSLAIVAWALDGPLAIGVLALFTRADLGQRARIHYNPRVYTTPLYASVLAGAACGVLWSGWLFANWLARR
jgi:hypothetical protein